jgi:hypothetical protein
VSDEAKMTTANVLVEVSVERALQDEQWGEQNHPSIFGESARRSYEHRAAHWKRINDARAADGSVCWDGILLEEVFEALAEEDPAARRAELLQVAAVCVAEIECIDRAAERVEPTVANLHATLLVEADGVNADE